MLPPQIKTITVEQVVQWIVQNRKDGNAFKKWTEQEVRLCILKASDCGTLRIDTNNKGEIFGVIVFEPVIYINQILTTQKYSLQNLLETLVRQFPLFGCMGNRNGKIRRYNVTRTMQILSTKD